MALGVKEVRGVGVRVLPPPTSNEGDRDVVRVREGAEEGEGEDVPVALQDPTPPPSPCWFTPPPPPPPPLVEEGVKVE